MPHTRRAHVATVLSTALALAGLQLVAGPSAQADISAKIATFPYLQDWSDGSLIATNDNWSGVPGVEGYPGGGLATTGADPQGLVAEP